MGIILPSIRSETCLKDLTSGLTSPLSRVTMATTLLIENDEDFEHLEDGNSDYDIEYGDTSNIR